jgi:hypothetical protein
MAEAAIDIVLLHTSLNVRALPKNYEFVLTTFNGGIYVRKGTTEGHFPGGR